MWTREAGPHVHKCPHTMPTRLAISAHGRRSAPNYHALPATHIPPLFTEGEGGSDGTTEPLVCTCLAWLRCTQERASTVPPQGQVPSRGLVPLSPVLTRCCPSRRKRPHLAEWIPSSTGRLRKEERKREKGTKRAPLAELRLQCTQLASRGQQTLNLAQVTVPQDLRTAIFSSIFPLLLTPTPPAPPPPNTHTLITD